MTDKKYTNEDIISSLKIIATTRDCNECKIRNCKWGTCNCSQITANAALDLITRQQAEIENLKVEKQSLRTAANSLRMHYEEAQAAIMRLKSCVKSEDEVREIAKRTMEPLVKEITREQIDIAVKLSKAEAYKECLAKVKNYIKTHCNPYGKPDFDYDTSIKVLNFIGNLLKEMVGENNDL